MKNYIKKMNFYHSLIFFLMANIFSLIIDQTKNLTVSPLICLLLILSIGISHGSLDHIKGQKLLNTLKINNIYFFYIGYIFIAICIIVIWLIFPIITLTLFLFVASYHFGKEDTVFLINNHLSFNQILYLVRLNYIWFCSARQKNYLALTNFMVN